MLRKEREKLKLEEKQLEVEMQNSRDLLRSMVNLDLHLGDLNKNHS